MINHVLLAVCLVPAFCCAASATAQRPHVLFIAIDDLRCELGCYGADQVHSPNIDQLAAAGVLFENAHCQIAVCNPSRVSLMTGLRPDSTKVWDLVTRFRHTIPDVVTLPQQFTRHGYYAASFGKIFHNPWPDNESWSEPHQWPPDRRLWSDAAKQQLADYRDKMRAAGKSESAIKRMRAVATEIVDLPDSEHVDGAIADQALAAMRRLAGQDQPFFIAAGFVRPHLPFVVPRKYWELYDRDKIPLANNQFIPKSAPPFAMNTMYELRDYMDYADSLDPRDGALTAAQQRELKHGYYAAVSMIDAQVGRLLNELDKLGIADNTIVVLWSDHGWKLGEHNSWCKQTNYEIDTRVPLIIRAPRAKTNGRATQALVELVDLYPTLCELSGIPTAGHLEGESLVPLLNGSKATIKEAAFSQFRRRDGRRQLMGYAMRTDRYRYIEWIDRSTRKSVARELYDHRSDPQENENLANDSAQSELVGRLNRQLWDSLPPPPAWQAAARSQQRPVIRFRNDSRETVAVYWISDDGIRKQLGKIEPGKTLRQNSTHGHRFLLVGSQSGLRTTATVKQMDQTVTTTDKLAARAADRPNIVVIMGDDWSWPHASILGDAAVKTPAFDRIASEGVLFENAFVSSPSCTPSRFAFVSGQHHWRLADGDSLGGSLAVDVPAYPDMLAEAGYMTGFCRKGAAPSQHEFRGNDPFGPRYQNFAAFLSQRLADEPFCFWYGAGEPHRPYDWQASLKSNIDLAKIKVPACLPDNETVRTDLGDYYLGVQKLDRHAGEILRQLEAAGELDKTIVIMTGDNGMPFPRCKATLYDMGTRVPLAIRWGKRTDAGRTVQDFVSLTDLAPTILQAAGLTVPKDMTGQSLIKQLIAQPSGWIDADRDHVFMGRERHVQSWPARAIRTTEFLYVRNHAPQLWDMGAGKGELPNYDFTATPWPTTAPAFSFNCDPSPTKQWLRRHQDTAGRLHRLAFGVPDPEELYDLKSDPDQLNNVVKDPNYRDQRTSLSQRLDHELDQTKDPRGRQFVPANQ